MAGKTQSNNAELYDLLRSKGYKPVAKTSVDKAINPEDADVFAFTFVKNGKSYGTARVSIDPDSNLILYFNDRLESSPDTNTSGTEFTDSWSGFKRQLRQFAKSRLLNFIPRNDDHLHDDMKQRTYMKKKDKVVEGYYPIGKKASYSDSVPQTKIIIQHTRQIEEGEQRYRNIARIFVENVNGERFLLPTIRPGIAKVYARHIAEGGTPYDDKGKHITSLVEEYTKMAGFVRATRNGQFNESAQRLVNEGITHYSNLRETLSRMISQRGYHKYFDSYTPVLNEETDDNTTINELFVQETLDPRIESVMPILARLSKNINEMSEIKELDEWAQNLVNETLEASEDIEEGKLAKAAMLGLAGIAAMNPMAAKAGGVSLPGSGGAFNADQQVQLNKSMEQQGAIEELQKFLAKQGLRQTISGELDNVTYDNIMKASQMHDAGKMSPEAAKMFQSLSNQAGLLKEGDSDDHPAVGAIINRILRQHPDLLGKYGPGKVLAAVQDVANGLGDLEEIGSSDVSIWVKEVASNLTSGQYDHIDEGDMDESKTDIINKIRKKFNRIEEGPADEPISPDMDIDDKRFDDAEPYEDMSDSELMNICRQMGMEKMCVRDGEGGLANRDEVINALYMQDHDASLEEDLDANQKRVGQLGPTEPVGKNEKNLRGKLVGASESVELDAIKTLSGIK